MFICCKNCINIKALPIHVYDTVKQHIYCFVQIFNTLGMSLTLHNAWQSQQPRFMSLSFHILTEKKRKHLLDAVPSFFSYFLKLNKVCFYFLLDLVTMCSSCCVSSHQTYSIDGYVKMQQLNCLSQ